MALFVASAAWPFACRSGTTVEEIAAVVRLSDAVVVVTGADEADPAPVADAAPARPVPAPRRPSASTVSWSTAVDEATGDTYYINNETGESQWEAPSSMA